MAAVTTRSPAAARRHGALRASQNLELAGPLRRADVSSGAQRGRALGLIVWGSSAGSILGPELDGAGLASAAVRLAPEARRS